MNKAGPKKLARPSAEGLAGQALAMANLEEGFVRFLRLNVAQGDASSLFVDAPFCGRIAYDNGAYR